MKKKYSFLNEPPVILLDIMCEYICCNLDIISHERNGMQLLHDDILLSQEICDSLLETYQLHHPHLNDKIAVCGYVTNIVENGLITK